MRWLSRRRASHMDPLQAELETAKEILAEVFSIQSAEVEEMIQARLQERAGPDEEWPATFCLEG
ncbi:MAG: hypothetical protein QUS08_00705 [Methanothrix sp.]|nr:hypothetical protein [Methanothrix sp.]